MRSVIEHLFKKYQQKAGTQTPATIRYDSTKVVPAHMNTKINRSTGQVLSAELVVNPRHYQQTARASVKDTNVYLKHTIAHEVGHLKQVEEWGGKRAIATPRFMAEDDADRRATFFTGYDQNRVSESMASIQEKLKNMKGGKR